MENKKIDINEFENTIIPDGWEDASTKLVNNTTHASASRRAKHSLRIRRKVARFTLML